MVKQLQITLVRSLIGRNEKQRATVRALGIQKMHQTVMHADTPSIRGMVGKISHLVKCVEVEE